MCVLVHLVTMIVAVRGGLTAAEILGRTRGNAAWGAFYALFVVAVAVHAPLGLRTALGEWLGRRGRALDLAAIVVGVLLLAGGLRAVMAVTTA
jgi:fumarate reductase subunit C